MLERHARKPARAVLRGGGGGNATSLPGKARHMAKGDRWSDDQDVKVREMRSAETILGVNAQTTGEPLEIERCAASRIGLIVNAVDWSSRQLAPR